MNAKSHNLLNFKMAGLEESDFFLTIENIINEIDLSKNLSIQIIYKSDSCVLKKYKLTPFF